jgi:hypothetical protein
VRRAAQISKTGNKILGKQPKKAGMARG